MLNFRLCEQEDKNIWIKLNREFMDFEIQDEELWCNTSKVSDEIFANTFKEALTNSEMISLMHIEEDEKIIGFANLVIIFSVWSHGKAMIIDDLFIKEEYHGKGYGKKSFEYIEKYAIELGCKRLQFISEKTNPNAYEFYRHIGYQPEDIYFYVKDLK